MLVVLYSELGCRVRVEMVGIGSMLASFVVRADEYVSTLPFAEALHGGPK